MIIADGDIIAFGAYEPSVTALATFRTLHATHDDERRAYFTSFEHNRDEHPHGRPFEVILSPDHLQVLLHLCDQPEGQNDKPLFFDHVVSYRRGDPIAPLFSFHDAFTGGKPCFSTVIPEDAIRALGRELGVRFTREKNPEWS